LLQEISSESVLPGGRSELQLIELDPQRVHVYWHIEPEREEPERRQVLRVHDITATGDISRPEQTYDISVRGREGRWYLDFWRGERVFVAELGYLDERGSLERLALSNEVHTPPAGPLSGSEFAEINLDLHEHPVQTVLPGPVKTAEPEAALKPQEETLPLEQAFPLFIHESTALKQVAPEALETLEDEIASSIPPPAAPSLAGEAMVAFSEEEEAEIATEAVEPAFPAADILDACAPENAAALEAFYREIELHPPPEPAPAPAPAHHETAHETAEVQAHPSTPSSVPSQTAATAPTPLESIVGWSSLLPAGGQDVLLEINAELRVFGRAKPGAHLTLHGQTIQLRPDGTFSIVRKLPSGSVVMPLLAKSTP
jgi:hypothetical protein